MIIQIIVCYYSVIDKIHNSCAIFCFISVYGTSYIVTLKKIKSNYFKLFKIPFLSVSFELQWGWSVERQLEIDIINSTVHT